MCTISIDALYASRSANHTEKVHNVRFKIERGVFLCLSSRII